MSNNESNATPPPEDNIPSIPELDSFIFQIDRFKKGVVPRRLDADKVALYLIGKTNREMKLLSLEQVEKTADFYHTNEVVPKFKTLLNKQENNSEELRKSIILTRIIAKLGDSEAIKFADDYYKYLVSRLSSFEDFSDAIILHENLSKGGDSSLINQKVQEKIAELKAAKDTNNQARINFLNFQEKISLALIRAEKVQAIKEQILALADRNKRLEEEIKAYLSIDYGYLEFLQPWAIRRIQSESFAQQIPQQNVRAKNAGLREDVAKSFRTFLSKVDSFDLPTKEEKEAAKLSILRAIKFFDGKLNEDEEDFLANHKGMQIDVLANEGFLLE